MIFDCIRMAIGDYNEAVIWSEGPTMSIVKQRLHNYLVVIQATGNVFGHNTVSQSIVVRWNCQQRSCKSNACNQSHFQ